jgi:hypothetical protein
MKSRLAKEILFLAGISIAIFASSCSHRQVKNADVQGRWVPDKASQRWIIAPQDQSKCQIVLSADGTFSATVPDYLMKTSDRSSGRIMVGRGRWALSDELFQSQVKLNFSEVDGRRINWAATPLKVQSRGEGRELFFYIGKEGGDRFLFERVRDDTR